jgi:hypothetical protein
VALRATHVLWFFRNALFVAHQLPTFSAVVQDVDATSSTLEPVYFSDRPMWLECLVRLEKLPLYWISRSRRTIPQASVGANSRCINDMFAEP